MSTIDYEKSPLGIVCATTGEVIVTPVYQTVTILPVTGVNVRITIDSDATFEAKAESGTEWVTGINNETLIIKIESKELVHIRFPETATRAHIEVVGMLSTGATRYAVQIIEWDLFNLTKLSTNSISEFPETLPPSIKDLSYFNGGEVLTAPTTRYAGVNIYRWDLSNVENLAYFLRGTLGIPNVTVDLSSAKVVEGLFENWASMLTCTLNNFSATGVSLERLFSGCTKLTTITGLNNLNECTSLRYTYNDCVLLNRIIPTVAYRAPRTLPSITDISYAFQGCKALADVKPIIQGLDLSLATDGEKAFASANVGDVSELPPFSNIVNGVGMFYTATASGEMNWQLSELVYAKEMFRGVIGLVYLSAPNFVALEDASSMTYGASITIDMTGSSLQNLANADRMFFDNVVFNSPLPDMPKLTTAEYMFKGTKAFNSQLGSLPSLLNARSMFYLAIAYNKPLPDMPNLVDANSMFFEATAFNSTVGSMPKLTDATAMFRGAKAFDHTILDLPSLVTADQMFLNAIAFNSVVGQLPSLSSAISMFFGAVSYNQPLSSLPNLSNATSMFSGAESFNQPLGVLPKLTVATNMFYGAIGFNSKLEGLPELVTAISMFQEATSYNQPLGALPKLVNAKAMFQKATGFNATIESLPSLITADQMFQSATSYNKALPDLPNLTTGNGMFNYAISFNAVIGSLPKLTDGTSMFLEAAAYNQPLPELPKLSIGVSMFQGAVAYNQPIGALPSLSSAISMFQGATAFNALIGSLPLLQYATSMFQSAASYNQVLPELPSLTIATSMFRSTVAYNQPLPNLPVVQTASTMFQDTIAYNQPLPTLPNLTVAISMFQGALTYNQPLPELPRLINSTSMFQGAVAYNQPLPALPSLVNVTSMFYDALKFNQSVQEIISSPSIVSFANFLRGADMTDQTVDFEGSSVNDISSFAARSNLRAVVGLDKVPSTRFDTSRLSGAFNTTLCICDLSSWCVNTIKTAPTNFNLDAPNVIAPNWGAACA